MSTRYCQALGTAILPCSPWLPVQGCPVTLLADLGGLATCANRLGNVRLQVLSRLLMTDQKPGGLGVSAALTERGMLWFAWAGSPLTSRGASCSRSCRSLAVGECPKSQVPMVSLGLLCSPAQSGHQPFPSGLARALPTHRTSPQPAEPPWSVSSLSTFARQVLASVSGI